MDRLVVVVFLSAGCREPDAPADPDTDTGTDTGTGVDPSDQDQDGFVAADDCDDGDADVYPGAPDVCGDDRVTDCDRTSDDGLVTVDGADTFDDLADAPVTAVEGAD